MLVLAIGLGAVLLSGAAALEPAGWLAMETAFVATAVALVALGVGVLVVAVGVDRQRREATEAHVLATRSYEREAGLPEANVEELVDERASRIEGRVARHHRALEALEPRIERLEVESDEMRTRIDGLPEPIVQAVGPETYDRRFQDLEQAVDRIDERQEQLRMIAESTYARLAKHIEHDDDTLERMMGELREAKGRQETLVDLLARAGTIRAHSSGTDGGNGDPTRWRRVGSEPSYPIAAYRIEKIHGMSKDAAETLHRHGVNLSDALLHTDLDALAASTGLDREDLQRWRDTAELMSIDGIGPELGVRLVEQDVRSIGQLAALQPDELSRLVRRSYEEEGREEPGILARAMPSNAKSILANARAASERIEWAPQA